MNLQQLKALSCKLNECSKEIYKMKSQMNERAEKANFMHTAATYSIGDFNPFIISNVTSASVQVACRKVNIIGFPVLQFDKVDTGTTQVQLPTCRGSSGIRKCKRAYQNVLDSFIKLASLQISFLELSEATRVIVMKIYIVRMERHNELLIPFEIYDIIVRFLGNIAP
eukprot:180382_1